MKSKFRKGTAVKMDGNVEPCVVYRVIDDNEQMLLPSIESVPGLMVPHIHLEVIGLVPVSYLVAADHPNNMFALDKVLHLNNRTN